MSWFALALIELALLTSLLLASAAVLRRAMQRVAPPTDRAPSSRRAARDPNIASDARALANEHSIAHAIAADQAGAAMPEHAQVQRLQAERTALEAGWQRLRDALHLVLESAAPVLPQSSWGELHRLLCAADMMFGVRSPSMRFRDDEPTEHHPQQALLQGLQELRALLQPHAESELAQAISAVVAALTVTVDALVPAERTDEAKVEPRHDATAKPSPRVETPREAELRQMILQFTHDSRDMLGCIRRLESENANLRTQLGDAGKQAA